MKQHEAIFPLKMFLRNTRPVSAAQRAPRPVLTAGKEPRPRQPAGPGPAKHVSPPTGRQRGGEPADNFSPLTIFNPGPLRGRLRAAPQRPPHGGARPLAAVGGLRAWGGQVRGGRERRRERSRRPPSLTHSPVGLAAPVPAAAPKLKAMRGRGVWVLPGRTGGASGTTPPRRLSAWYRLARPRPLCPRSGCTTARGGGGGTVCVWGGGALGGWRESPRGWAFPQGAKILRAFPKYRVLFP